jgi:hypothetical protein
MGRSVYYMNNYPRQSREVVNQREVSGPEAINDQEGRVLDSLPLRVDSHPQIRQTISLQ